MRNDRWPQKRARALCVLLGGVLSLTMFNVAQAKSNAPFVADAITKAQQAPTAEGKWKVLATVKFSAPQTADMNANGQVTAVANSPEGELTGVLPMTISGGASQNSTLALSVKRDGTVGIQWLIAGKPFLGRPMQYVDAIPVGDSLSAKIDFGGAKRLMKLTLTSEWVKNSPPPIRQPKGTPQATEKKPIGKRYKITGYLLVTNSEDGFLDNTVEIDGVLNYYQVADGGADKNALPEKTLLTIIKQDMKKGKTLPFDNNRYADYIYADPRTKCLIIRGSIYDDDAGINDDPMLVGRTRAMPLEMLAKEGQQHFSGDNDSESCDIYYTVTEVGDLY